MVTLYELHSATLNVIAAVKACQSEFSHSNLEKLAQLDHEIDPLFCSVALQIFCRQHETVLMKPTLLQKQL